MAETPRRSVGSTEPKRPSPQFKVLYGFLLRVRIDDPLGDYSEQTGAQFG